MWNVHFREETTVLACEMFASVSHPWLKNIACLSRVSRNVTELSPALGGIQNQPVSWKNFCWHKWGIFAGSWILAKVLSNRQRFSFRNQPTNPCFPFMTSKFKGCSVNWFSSQACRKRLKNSKSWYKATKTRTTNYKELSNRWRKISTGWRKRFKKETKPFKIRYFLFDLFTMLFVCLFWS